MKWCHMNFKTVCRHTLTHAHLDQLQAERACHSLEPFTLEQLVLECVVNPQSHHYDRAKFLLAMKGSAA